MKQLIKNFLDKRAPMEPHGAIASQKSLNEIDHLLKSGCDVNGRDDDGNTPLHLAARYHSDPKVLELLLNAGAELEPENKEEKTPLHFAVENNENTEVKSLLRYMNIY